MKRSRKRFSHLAEEERKNLFDWIGELAEEAWDREMEENLLQADAGNICLPKVEAVIAAGKIPAHRIGLRSLADAG